MSNIIVSKLQKSDPGYVD